MPPVSQYPQLKNPTRLAVYRHSAGVTQKTLQQLTGIPRSSIANYEARVNHPGPAVAERLAAALNLTAEEVFPPEDATEN
jgi:transcriptional regulator with XRE-family HTH domain